MTREETTKVLAVLYSEFGNKPISDVEVNDKINLWATMFKDDDARMVNLAVYKLLATSKWFPKIAEVKAAIAEMHGNQVIDSGEAWGEVTRAIRKYGYSQEEKAIASMNPLTASAVKYMGWRNICESEDMMADRAHFLRIYEQLSNKEKEKLQVPIGIQNKIAMAVEEKQAERGTYIEEQNFSGKKDVGETTIFTETLKMIDRAKAIILGDADGV